MTSVWTGNGLSYACLAILQGPPTGGLRILFRPALLVRRKVVEGLKAAWASLALASMDDSFLPFSSQPSGTLQIAACKGTT